MSQPGEAEQSKERVTALAAAYQVTARLLASEQTTIWARVAGFGALTGLITTAVGSGSSNLQILLGATGLVLGVVLFASLERSFDFRDHFATLMKEQETALGITNVGPLKTGYEADFGSKLRCARLRTQRVTFRVLVGILAVAYLGILLHGLGHLAFIDKAKDITK